MASGTIAPISASKGAGIDVDVHQFQYPGEGDAQVCAGIYESIKNVYLVHSTPRQLAALSRSQPACAVLLTIANLSR